MSPMNDARRVQRFPRRAVPPRAPRDSENDAQQTLPEILGEQRSPMSDEDLMRVLHDQHARALWNYLVGLTNGDRARAQDIVQETLLRAWRNPSVLDQSRGSARPWLFTVARRILIDEWRSSRARHEVLSDTPPEGAVSDQVDQLNNRRLVVAALSRLSADHREVLSETYLRGSTVAEAALKLGVPTGTVKSRTHYALQAFRHAIDEVGGAN